MQSRFDVATPDMFETAHERAGSLACGIEIAATMADALERAGKRGMKRDAVAAKMSHYLGEAVSENMLNAYTAQSRDKHEINLRRAMAFDAAIGEDVFLSLYAAKRGGRVMVTNDDAALLEWARLHRAEKEAREQRRALEAVLKRRGK